MLNANTSIRGRWTRSYVKGQGVSSPLLALTFPALLLCPSPAQDSRAPRTGPKYTDLQQVVIAPKPKNELRENS